MPEFDTSEFCKIQQDHIVEELVVKITDSNSQIAQAIENSGSEWMQFFIALGGAFFGALAAFILNWLHERTKERQANNTAINEVIQLFSTNIMTLLNYKAQFLHKFACPLKAISSHAAEYHPQMSPARLTELSKEWDERCLPIINWLIKKYEKHGIYHNLNGLLVRKWEPIKLASVDVKQLYFVMDSMPDTIRLALHTIARAELLQDALKERDEIYLNAAPALGSVLWQPHPEFMRHLYELINIRQNMAEYIDEIVIMAHATNLSLMHYQKGNFPRHKGLLKWLVGSYIWVRYDIPDDARNMMPKVNGYKEIIGPNWDKIKEQW